MMKLELFGFIALFSLFSPPSFGQPEWRSSFQTLLETYERTSGDSALPFSQYGQLYVQENNAGISITSDFRYATDFGDINHRLDLYEGRIEWNAKSGKHTVEAGRIQLISGIDYFLLDGAKVTTHLPLDFRLSLFGGSTRTTDLSSDRENAWIYGLGIFFPTVFDIQHHASFLFEDYDAGAEDQRVRYGILRAFRTKIPFSLSGASEFSLEKKGFSEATFLSDTRWTSNFHTSLQYLFRDPLLNNNSVERDLIFELFSISDQHLGAIHASIHPVSWFILQPGYEFSTYVAPDAHRKKSHNPKIQILFDEPRIDLHVLFDYRLWLSHGGRNHLMSTRLKKQWLGVFDSSLGAELALYRKYTGESAKASRLFFRQAWDALRWASLAARMDLLSNEDRRTDFRIFLLLETRFGSSV